MHHYSSRQLDANYLITEHLQTYYNKTEFVSTKQYPVETNGHTYRQAEHFLLKINCCTEAPIEAHLQVPPQGPASYLNCLKYADNNPKFCLVKGCEHAELNFP